MARQGWGYIDPSRIVSGGSMYLAGGGLALPMTPANFYAFQAMSTDGEMSLRYDATLWQFILRMRGVDVLSVVAENGPYPLGDGLLHWECWYNPSGTKGLKITVNGAALQYADNSGSGSGSALASPTVAVLASAIAGGSVLLIDRPWVRYGSATATFVDPAVELLWLGDSIMSGHKNDVPTASYVYSYPDAYRRVGIGVLAYSGDTSTGQNSKLNAASAHFKAAPSAIVRIGWNDITNGASPATLLANIQTLVSNIRSKNPSGKIVVCTMTPGLQYMINHFGSTTANAYDATRQSVNASIVGGALTNVDGVETSWESQLNDGTNRIKSQYDSGDGLHPSPLGRTNGGAFMAAAINAVYPSFPA